MFLLPPPFHFRLTLPISLVDFPQPLPDGPIINVVLREWDTHDFDYSSDALSDWLNARWRKTGYEVSREIVWCILKINGRLAFERTGDWDGIYMRKRGMFYH
jgi:hypothetical protein